MHQFVSTSASAWGAGLIGDPRDAPALSQIWVARRDEHRVEPAALHHAQVRSLIEQSADDAVSSELTLLWQRGARFLVVRDRADQVLACGAVMLDSGEVGGLLVDAALRRTGLGERLLRGLEQDARRARCSRLWLRASSHRHAALRLFERLRYERCVTHARQGASVVLMSKRL